MWRMKMKMRVTTKIFAAFAVLAVMGIAVGFAVNVNGAIVNALTGFQYNGTAPTNHVLCGNGSVYVDAAACGTVAMPFYQAIDINGTSGLPQRSILNFTTNFTGRDTNPSTTIDLAPTITSNTAGNAATASFAANSNLVGGVGLTGLCQTTGAGCPAISSIDYYWTITAGCNPGVGQPARCITTTPLPINMPDANYQIFCSTNDEVSPLTGSTVCSLYNGGILPTAAGSTFSYQILQVVQGASGGATPQVYFHAHHN
jgi:hypothetical protein